MRYFKVSDKTQDLNKLYTEGFVAGEKTGWSNLDENLSYKKGYPVFVAGAPHSGKTEFIIEQAMVLSLNKGWKWFVYTGEAGSIAELVSDMAHKLIGLPYAKKVIGGKAISMNETDKTYAEYFVSEHFYFLDTEDIKSTVKDFTVNEFYQIVNDCEMQEGVKFDGTILDPWNDVVNETKDYGGREDLWLADALKVVRRDAKQHNRLNIVINHISDVKPIADKDTGRRYYPVALPSEWAGGRTWWRRAYLMILIYRPPMGLNNPETGEPYRANESHIIVQKAKPKGIAKLGKTVLFWDWKSNRYYEDESLTITPFVKSKGNKIEPNLTFDLTPTDDLPF